MVGFRRSTLCILQEPSGKYFGKSIVVSSGVCGEATGDGMAELGCADLNPRLSTPLRTVALTGEVDGGGVIFCM